MSGKSVYICVYNCNYLFIDSYIYNIINGKKITNSNYRRTKNW